MHPLAAHKGHAVYSLQMLLVTHHLLMSAYWFVHSSTVHGIKLLPKSLSCSVMQHFTQKRCLCDLCF